MTCDSQLPCHRAQRGVAKSKHCATLSGATGGPPDAGSGDGWTRRCVTALAPLPMAAWRRIAAAYHRGLATAPIRTKMAIGCVLYGIGDASAQYLEHRLRPAAGGAARAIDEDGAECSRARDGCGHEDARSGCPPAAAHGGGNAAGPLTCEPAGDWSKVGWWDWVRTARLCAWRVVVFTVPAHFFYTYIDRVVRFSSPALTTVARVAVDQLVWTPPIFTTCIVWDAWFSGRDVREAVEERFWPVLRAGWTVWPLVHALTFSVIPPAHRVTWVNAVSVVWAAVFSYVNNSAGGRVADTSVDSVSAQAAASS